MLLINRGQELDGYQHFVSWLGRVEKHYGLQVFAHGNAPAVEVDDLRHGAICVGFKMEPDAAAGQIVTVEGLGHFDQAAIPDCFSWTLCSRLDFGPTGVVEIDRLSVLQVPSVKSPFAGRELAQFIEFLDHLLRRRGECFHYFRDFSLGVLGPRGGGQKGDAEERDREKLTATIKKG